jgi:hypothetical protein
MIIIISPTPPFTPTFKSQVGISKKSFFVQQIVVELKDSQINLHAKLVMSLPHKHPCITNTFNIIVGFRSQAFRFMKGEKNVVVISCTTSTETQR